MSQPQLRVKFISDSGFADALKAEAAAHPDDLKIESENVEKDATKLGFGLATAVAIVAIAKGVMDAATFAAKIYAWWSEQKKAKNVSKIVLQTPFKTLELHSTSPLTEDDIRKFLEASSVAVK